VDNLGLATVSGGLLTVLGGGATMAGALTVTSGSVKVREPRAAPPVQRAICASVPTCTAGCMGGLSQGTAPAWMSATGDLPPPGSPPPPIAGAPSQHAHPLKAP
jgi:hypothetical protein